MYKFIEKWEEINRKVVVNKNTIDIIENGKVRFKFYLGGIVHLRIYESYTTRDGISSFMLDLLNETMKELESEINV